VPACAEAAVPEMEAELVAEVGVGQAVAVGDAEMLGCAQVAGSRACDSGAGHGRRARERHGHQPAR
jgi:hypothetical protein